MHSFNDSFILTEVFQMYIDVFFQTGSVNQNDNRLKTIDYKFKCKTCKC